MQHRERVFGLRDARPERSRDVVVVARRDVADPHALGLERGVELVVHDPAVAHDDHAGVLARFGRPRPAARRALVARRAELLVAERPVAVEVELVDAAVAPDLLASASARRSTASRSAAATRRCDEPVGPAERTRRVEQ